MTPLPFPISTDRLTIRFYEERDRALDLAIHDDALLVADLGIDVRTPAEIDEFVKKWVGRHTLDEVGATVSLPVELLADSSYVGAVQLTPIEVDPTQVSIGWLTLPIHQRKGLMSEAVSAVVDVAFGEASVHRIVAEITEGNDGSVRLAERLGFRKEAHFVDSLLLRDEWRDETVYALLANEWKT